MKTVIIQGLSQAYSNLVHMFAEFLPRLLVMLVIVAVGLVVAYCVEDNSARRSPRHPARSIVRRSGCFAIFAHGRASFYDRTAQPLAILGNLVRIYFDWDKRARRRRPPGTNFEIILTVAGDIRSDIDFIPGIGDPRISYRARRCWRPSMRAIRRRSC